MNPARIAELLQPFLSPDSTKNACHSEPAQSAGEACPERSRREPASLSPAQLQDISTYIDILLRWNARMNLTAVRDEEQIVTRHFGESLFAASHLFPTTSAISASSAVKSLTVADVGSGAGFPGLPIKLWAPDVALTLIESSHKKTTFLREVTRALTLTDINILTTRAESIECSFDVVTLRAVERFETVLPVAARLVAPEGRLALLIGSSQADQATALLPASFRWSDPDPIPLSGSRILAVASHLPA